MNCPNCESPNVVPEDGQMRCQDCKFGFEPASSAEPTPSAPQLIKCPACSHQVSSQAVTCPSCGQPLQPGEATRIVSAFSVSLQKYLWHGIIWAVIFFIVVSFLKMAIGDYIRR